MTERRAPGRRRWGLLLLLALLGLWLCATPVRLAFAELLGTVTGGRRALAVPAGLLVGAAPLLAGLLVLLGSRGPRSDVPWWSAPVMLTSLFLPVLLSTWAGRYAPEDEDVRAVFEQQAPGYLTGHLVGLGTVLGLLLLFGVVVGVVLWREHQARRTAGQDS